MTSLVVDYIVMYLFSIEDKIMVICLQHCQEIAPSLNRKI